MDNWFKTTLLLGALTILMLIIGKLIGGQQGMYFAFILAIGMNFFSYWYSDKIVLRMHHASEINPQEHPDLYQMVDYLAQRANIPMPRVYLIPGAAPNAFATGRSPEYGIVAVTEGLLNLMNRDEIMGVLAHEMAHIKNRDILIGSIAATMAGAIMIIANMARWSAIFGFGSQDDDEGGLGVIGMILMSILAPIAAMVVQMAISRSREYLADATGANFVGDPKGLANALRKLGTYSERIPMQADPNTAHMFIVSPLTGGNLANLFSTHPPLEDRIARLTGSKSFPRQSQGGSGNGKDAAAKAWKDLTR